MKPLHLIILALLAGALAVSACGMKGDPVRPGAETEEQEDG